MGADYRELTSRRNLELAWRRITTALNWQYKRFFRPLIAAYEVGLQENLRYLRERLHGVWTATPPGKIFLPKPSGLQRTISLLALEDQIVYQAVANIVARNVARRRRKIENRVAFSHCLNGAKNSIFFLQRWQDSYGRFKEKVEAYYESGWEYVAYFDFAAFYDTISHEVLLRTIAPRSHDSRLWRTVRKWLKTWSSSTGAIPLEQGLPQGPIASDFLAEVFLMPLDEAMNRSHIHYVRYGDDVRILASTEMEARRAAIKLEIRCKDLGLIPQAKKYGIGRVTSLQQALGSLPSIRPSAQGSSTLTEEKAWAIFSKSLTGRPAAIADKSRARYVLFHAPASRRLLKKAVNLLPRHPEQIDAFCAFFSRFARSRPLEKAIVEQLKGEMPYAYVRGELWHILAHLSCDGIRCDMAALAHRDLKTYHDALSLQWGAMHFLLHCQQRGTCRWARGVLAVKPLAQALLIADLPDGVYTKGNLVPRLLAGAAFEPGIVLASKLVEHHRSLRSYRLRERDLRAQVQNVFRRLGLLGRGSSVRHDQVGSILSQRFGIASWTKWRKLLGKEYDHALQILLPGDAIFDVSPSGWIQYQDSFNDLVFRCMQGWLAKLGLPGRVPTIHRGKNILYGKLLDPCNQFSRAYPGLAQELREFHDRRNHVPSSHPYDLRTGTRTSYVRHREKGVYRSQMTRAYGRIIALLDPRL